MSLRRKILSIITAALFGFTIFLYITSRIFLIGRVAQLAEQNVDQDTVRAVYAISGELSSINAYSLVFLIATAFVLGAALMISLEKIVLSRLTKLSDDVNAISVSGDMAIRMRTSGTDELALLARNINNLLVTLEHSQETLIESNTRLRTVVNNAPLIIWAMDKDRKLNLLEGAGLTALDIAQVKMGLLAVSELSGILSQLTLWNQSAFEGETSASIVQFGTLEFEVRYTPLRDSRGSIVGVIGVATDITERKQAEMAMRESEEKFRRLFDLAPIGMAITDSEGQLARMNQAFCDLVGYLPSEMSVPNLEDITYPGDYSKSLELIRSTLIQYSDDRERSIQQSEARFIARDGRIIDTILQASLIPETSASSPFVLIQIVDITERKRAEESLRQSEVRFRSLVESARDYIHLINLGCEIIQTNTVSLFDSGYREDEFVGHSFVEFLTPHSQVAFSEQFAQLLRVGSGRQEIEFKRKNGSVVVMDFSGSVIYNDRGQPLNITVLQRDITERKRMEDALQKALQKEKELNELKSRFVTTASHEFRTPLATIQAAAETLSAYWGRLDAVQIEERLVTVQIQVARMTELMDDVLVMARMQAGKLMFNPIETDLDQFCRVILAEFQARPDITHHFVYTCSEPTVPAIIDQKLMRTIVSNLLTNAIKYSPANREVSIDLARVGDEINLIVRDEGIGIPEADLKHLFESFHRATNVGNISGTGLGLAIAKQAAETHGGTITCKSKVGVGSTFVVSIPVLTSWKKGH